MKKYGRDTNAERTRHRFGVTAAAAVGGITESLVGGKATCSSYSSRSQPAGRGGFRGTSGFWWWRNSRRRRRPRRVAPLPRHQHDHSRSWRRRPPPQSASVSYKTSVPYNVRSAILYIIIFQTWIPLTCAS